MNRIVFDEDSESAQHDAAAAAAVASLERIMGDQSGALLSSYYSHHFASLHLIRIMILRSKGRQSENEMKKTRVHVANRRKNSRRNVVRNVIKERKKGV